MRARVLEVVLVLVFIALAAAWCMPHREATGNRVTLHLKGADVVPVVESICAGLHRPLYLCANVSGTVWIDLDDEPAWSALRKVLQRTHRDLKYFTENGKVYVGYLPEHSPPHPLTKSATLPLNCGRQQVVFESASARDLVPYYRRLYPDAEFFEHPTMNACYMTGCRADVLALKHSLYQLDKPSRYNRER